MAYKPTTDTRSLKVSLGKVVLTGQAMTAGSTTLEVPGMGFGSDDVGRWVMVYYAGAAHVNGIAPKSCPLITKIASVVDNDTATLVDAAQSTPPENGVSVVLFRPVSCKGGSIFYDSSLATHDSAGFIIETKTGFKPVVGQPFLIEEATLGPLIGGFIRARVGSKVYGTDYIEWQCDCDTWDVVLYGTHLQILTEFIPDLGSGGDHLVFIKIEDGGHYSSDTPPLLTIDKPLGTGIRATAHAVMALVPNPILDFYRVDRAVIDNPGTEYTFTPNIAVSTGAARLTAVMNTTSSFSLNPNNGSFTDVDAGYVATWLLQNTNYGMQVCGLTFPEFTLGKLVKSITFGNNDTLGSALDSLISSINDGITDFWWGTDPFGRVTIALNTAVPAPFDLDTGSEVLQSVTAEKSLEKYVTRVFVNLQSAIVPTPIVEAFKGDNVTKSFNVSNGPMAVAPTIQIKSYLNTVDPPVFTPVTVKVVGSAQPSDPVQATLTWFWSPGSSTVTEGEAGGPLGTFRELVVTYLPTQTVLLLSVNEEATKERWAISGGAGLFKDAYISNDNSGSVPIQDGQSLGDATAKYYGRLPDKLKVVSYRPGLRTGQVVVVTMSDLDVSGSLLVSGVSMVTENNYALWTITLISGALTGDWRTAFLDLTHTGGPFIGAGVGLTPGEGGGGSGAIEYKLTSLAAALIQSGTYIDRFGITRTIVNYHYADDQRGVHVVIDATATLDPLITGDDNQTLSYWLIKQPNGVAPVVKFMGQKQVSKDHLTHQFDDFVPTSAAEEWQMAAKYGAISETLDYAGAILSGVFTVQPPVLPPGNWASGGNIGSILYGINDLGVRTWGWDDLFLNLPFDNPDFQVAEFTVQLGHVVGSDLIPAPTYEGVERQFCSSDSPNNIVITGNLIDIQGPPVPGFPVSSALWTYPDEVLEDLTPNTNRTYWIRCYVKSRNDSGGSNRVLQTCWDGDTKDYLQIIPNTAIGLIPRSLPASQIIGFIPSSLISAINACSIFGTINGSNITSINASQITGVINASQIGLIAASQITGVIIASVINTIAASQITGIIQASQIGGIFASQITGLILANQISSINANQINGTILAGQISSINASQINGTISASQISSINASQINGTINASQIGGVNASLIVGTINASQINAISASTITGVITAGQISYINASQIIGSVSTSFIGTIAASQITGVIAASQINSIAASQISGVITAGSFIGSITASQINGAIQASQINTINASQIIGAVSTSFIGTLAASQITGIIQASQINTITAGQVTGVITAGSYIGVVQASQISGAIVASQISTINASQIIGAVATSFIGTLAASQITGAITASQISSITATQIVGVIVTSQLAASIINSLSLFTSGFALPSSMITNIQASQVVGLITALQISSIAASQVAGLIQASQIQTIAASQIAGSINASNIGNISASAIVGQIQASQIGSISATQISGQIQASNIGSIQASSIVGVINVNQVPSTMWGIGMVYDPTTQTVRVNTNDPSNIIFDGGLDFGLTAFTAAPAGNIIASPFAYTPPYSARFLGDNSNWQVLHAKQKIPCTPGDAFVAGAYVYGFNANNPFYMFIYFYNAAGSVIGNNLGKNGVNLGVTQAIQGFGWGPVQTPPYYAPANCTSCDVLWVSTCTAGAEWYADNLYCFRGVPANQVIGINASVIQGQISASNIGSINASSITGQIQASQIGGVNAFSIVGLIGANQIGGVNANTIQGQINAIQIASVNSNSIAGQIQASQIGAVNANTITGLIQSAQIGTINAATITIGVIADNQIGSVNVSKLVAGTASFSGDVTFARGGSSSFLTISNTSITISQAGAGLVVQGGSVICGVLTATNALFATNIASLPNNITVGGSATFTGTLAAAISAGKSVRGGLILN